MIIIIIMIITIIIGDSIFSRIGNTAVNLSEMEDRSKIELSTTVNRFALDRGGEGRKGEKNEERGTDIYIHTFVYEAFFTGHRSRRSRLMGLSLTLINSSSERDSLLRGNIGQKYEFSMSRILPLTRLSVPLRRRAVDISTSLSNTRLNVLPRFLAEED